jgi:anti-sigma28 factor (negative regulator of flagellin synthesis)
MAQETDDLAAKNQRTVLKNLEVLDKKVAEIRESITKGTTMTLGSQHLLSGILSSLHAIKGSW